MPLTLWGEKELGLTNSEMDSNFRELGAGTIAQSVSDNLPLVKPTLNLDFTKGFIHPGIVFSSPDATIVLSGLNSGYGTYYIETSIASGQSLIGSSTTTLYSSIGAGKYALVYSGTTLTPYYNGVAQSSTTISGVDTTIKLFSVDSTNIKTKYYTVRWYPVALSSAKAIQLTSTV